MLSYQEPMTENISLPGLEDCTVRVLVRREDQNHPFVSGNKWWKLKYNLEYAIQNGFDSVLTFGGAFSNHIYATAAACKEIGINSLGVIRGEEVENETLRFAKMCGMKLHFVSRDAYRKKSETEFLESLNKTFKNTYIIPEGGTNALAVKGCEELGAKIFQQDFDYLILPVGTGGTIAGLINSFGGQRRIIGIPVLKDASFLNNHIKNFLKQEFFNWELFLDYHHGGYAKKNPALNTFIEELNIPTEFVYTGKMLWATRDLIQKEIIMPGSSVLALHTGGLRNQ